MMETIHWHDKYGKIECKWEGMKGTITSLRFEDDQYLVVETDEAWWKWVPVGDCCADAYIDVDDTTLEEMEALVGQEIVSLSVEDGGNYSIGHDNWDTRTIHFYRIQGNESGVTFTLHVDHNGYYDGQLELKDASFIDWSPRDTPRTIIRVGEPAVVSGTITVSG
jgi:hypothetical protein